MNLKKIHSLVRMIACLGIIFPVFSLASIAIDQKPQWQYYKDISISGAPQKGELVKVTIDADIFNHAREDLGDLRIIDEAGNEVPYKLAIERGEFAEENIYPVRILNNSYNTEGQYNIFIVDFGQAGFLNSSLNILTSSENFKRMVEISGGNDMNSWNVLKTNGYIYDYTDRLGSFKAQSTTVSYPENGYRYVRVKIFSSGEGAMSVSGAQISKIIKSERKESVVDPQFIVTENSVKRVTELVIDLEKKGWPTSGIKLAFPDENFNRQAVIYESNDKNNWRRAGQGYIFNYNTPKFVGANSEVSYSETNERYLKIEIFNGDDSPISVIGISVKTVLRSIAFQFKADYAGNSGYKIYYGNPKARFPEYDLEKFFPYLDTGVYYSTTLSDEQTNNFYQKEIPPEKPLTARMPYLLPAVLAITVLAMGLIVFRFMKKAGADKQTKS